MPGRPKMPVPQLLQIYDPYLDLMRPVIQSDVDDLTVWVARFGRLVEAIRLDHPEYKGVGFKTAGVLNECENAWAVNRAKKAAE